MAIHKYEVPALEGIARLPAGARLLHVAVQPTGPKSRAVFVWALVDPSSPMVRRKLGYFPTGDEPIPADCEYVGTAITDDGAFVWHIFDGGEVEPS